MRFPLRKKDFIIMLGLATLSLLLNFRGITVGLPSLERQKLSVGGPDAVEKALPEVHKVLNSNLGERSEFLDKTDKKQFAPLAKISPYLDQIRSFHPDEQFTLKALASMAKRKSPKPESYIYSPFFYYQIGAALLAGRITGFIPSESSVDYFLVHPDRFRPIYLCGRILCAIYGMLAVLAVYLTARRLTARHGQAFFAAALVACLPLVVLSAKFIKPEMPTLFWTALALYFSIGILQRGNWKDYLLAGICVGLAGGTKYPAVFSCLYVLFYHAARRRYGFQLKSPFSRSDLKLIEAGAAAAGAFFLLNPTILLDLSRFLGDLQWIKSVARDGNWLFNIADSFMLYCYDAFFYTMGYAAFIAMLAGVVYSCVKPRPTYLAMLPVIFIFIWLAAQGLFAEAYMIPAYVPLSLLAARAVYAIPKKSVRHAGVTIILVMTFGWSWAWLDSATHENARITAVRWINENIPAGAKIATERYPVSYRVPMVNPKRYKTVIQDIDGEAAAANSDYYINTSFQWLNVPFYDRYAGVVDEKTPFDNFEKLKTIEYVPRVFGVIPLKRRCRVTHFMEVVAPVINIYARKKQD